MTSTIVSSQAKDPFEEFCHRVESYMYKVAERLVRSSRYHCLVEAEDIYVQALMKIWKAYFAPEVKTPYYYKGEKAEKAFVKRIVNNIFIDLQRKWKVESQIVGSLQSPLKSNHLAVLEEVIPSNNRVEDEYVCRATIQTVVEDEMKGKRSELLQHVVADLFDELEDSELNKYTSNYVAVTKSRLRKKLCKALQE